MGLLPKGLPFPPSLALPSLALVLPPSSSSSHSLSQKLLPGQRFPWKAFSGLLVLGTPEPPCRLLATGGKNLH